MKVFIVRKNKYFLVIFIFIFLFLSCRKITEPILSLHNYKIVFTSGDNNQYDLYTIDLNDFKTTQLTFNGKSTSAQRSPDGKHIYFNSNGDICRMDLDGSNLINLTHSSSFEYEFSISSDGEKIAFVSDRVKKANELYRTEIFLMDLNGNASPFRISYSKYYSQFPCFSADGQLIAYESFDYDSVKFSIHFYSIIDSSDTIITPKGSSQGFPVFSPDGKYLSYFSWDDMKLYLLDLQTMNRKKLIYGREQEFSADGKFLYFLSTGIGGLDVFRYDILTDEIKNITNSEWQENTFDVTPDNQKIVFGAFLKADSSFISQIFIKNINFDQINRLTNGEGSKYKPVFFFY